MNPSGHENGRDEWRGRGEKKKKKKSRAAIQEQEIWWVKKERTLQADDLFFKFCLSFSQHFVSLAKRRLISRRSLGSLGCDCLATGNEGPRSAVSLHHPPSTDNICSGPPTEVMRARTMLWLLNHLICSALSRSVLGDTVAIHQSRHTHTFTRYQTHTLTHTHTKDKNILHLSVPPRL